MLKYSIYNDITHVKSKQKKDETLWEGHCRETEEVPSGIPNSQERGRGLDTAALP